MFVIRKYQEIGIDFLINRRRAVLADPTGSGKTLMGACALKKIQSSKNVIITPGIQIEGWVKTLTDIGIQIPIYVWSNNHFPEIKNQNSFILITTWGRIIERGDIYDKYLIAHVNKQLHWLTQTGIDLLILDEIHKIINLSSKTSKAARGLASIARYAWGLSATPIRNNNMEWFAIMQFLNHPSVMSKYSYMNFRKKYCVEKSIYVKGRTVNIIVGNKNTSQLMRELNGYILTRSRGEILKELPDIQRIPVIIKMDNKDKLEYQKQWESILKEKALKLFIDNQRGNEELFNYLWPQIYRFIKGDYIRLPLELQEHIDIISELETYLEFQKLVTLVKNRVWLHNFKVQHLCELLEDILDSEHKVVIASEFLDGGKKIKEWCKKNKVGYFEIYGGIPLKDRGKILRDFHNCKNNAILYGTKAIQTGTDGLQYITNIMIFLDLFWVPADILQSEGRIGRIGSKANKVIYYYLLVKDSTDIYIANKLMEKEKLLDFAGLEKMNVQKFKLS